MSRQRIEVNALSVQGISHGFFTRKGGVSSNLYGSLNCGFGSGDEFYNVKQNRDIVSEVLGSLEAPLITPYQHHSSDVIVATEPWSPDQAPKGDAIVTNRDNLAIGVLTADCAPVLLIDPVKRIVGAAHAGWRGAFAGVLENTVDAMTSLGAQKGQIVATIGPALSVANFEVGLEFYQQFIEQDATFDRFFTLNETSQKYHFDLVQFATAKLRKTGIALVESLPHCTYENESLFFSYRRNTHQSLPDYGRQISAIVIN